MTDSNGHAAPAQASAQDQSSAKEPIQPLIKWKPFAIEMLSKIQSGHLDPTTLTQSHRRLCLRVMLHQHTFTTQEMADILAVDRTTIWKDKKFLYGQSSMAQLMIDEVEIARDMMEHAEFAASRLDLQKKYKDAWTVRKECIEKLQTLGYVKEVAKKIDLTFFDVLELVCNQRESENDGETSGNGFQRIDGAEGDPGMD